MYKTPGFCVKIAGLSSNKDQCRNSFYEIFSNFNSYYEEILFKEDIIFLKCNNQNVGRVIFEKLNNLNIPSLIISQEEEPDNFVKSGSIIFPYPENPSVYDIVSIFMPEYGLVAPKDLIKDINFKDNEEYHFDKEAFCQTCHKSIPLEFDFCIFCGKLNYHKEVLQTFSIKITSIESIDTKVKLAKYFKDNTSFYDYKLLMDYLTRLPTIFNFSSYNSSIEKFLDILDNYRVSYTLIDTQSFSFDRFFSYFLPYGNVNLGTIKTSKNLLDPVISRLAGEVLQEISSDTLRKAVTKSLFEIYRILTLSRNYDRSARFMYQDIEKTLEELLSKFLFLMKKANQFNIYFMEHNPEKIVNEIKALETQKNNTTEASAMKIYQDTIELKEKEYQDLLGLSNSVEVLKSQIISISSLLGAMRTKLTYINTLDIKNNKREFSELHSIKESLVSKIQSMEEVLSL